MVGVVQGLAPRTHTHVSACLSVDMLVAMSMRMGDVP